MGHGDTEGTEKQNPFWMGLIDSICSVISVPPWPKFLKALPLRERYRWRRLLATGL